jgi:hypothetical protein
MCDIADDSIDHSKDRLDAISVGMNKKNKLAANNADLLRQSLNLILPYVREVDFKADKLTANEATGVKINCKFHDSNSKTVETQQLKKETTIWDIFWLIIERLSSINGFFQFIIMEYQDFMPQVLFLIFSMVVAV